MMEKGENLWLLNINITNQTGIMTILFHISQMRLSLKLKRTSG